MASRDAASAGATVPGERSVQASAGVRGGRCPQDLDEPTHYGLRGRSAFTHATRVARRAALGQRHPLLEPHQEKREPRPFRIVS